MHRVLPLALVNRKTSAVNAGFLLCLQEVDQRPTTSGQSLATLTLCAILASVPPHKPTLKISPPAYSLRWDGSSYKSRLTASTWKGDL